MKFFSFWRSLASHRVRVALNLKSLGREVIDIDILKGHQREQEFRAVNPQMLLPAIEDGKGPILFQSMAILEYLDEIHPQPPLLPQAPRDRAWVRGLAMIVACDAHPLIVPRVRNYLERELKIDEAARLKWIRHWFTEAFEALETLLSRDPRTGRFCYQEQVTTADICLASHVIGGEFFQLDAASYPTVKRIFDACMQEKAFIDAHPLKQPGAPKAVAH